MDRRERTDAQLVAMAVDGDTGAFAALVHRHAARIDAIVARDADPDERLVEVFATAMTRLADAPDDVGTWLESIARAAVGQHHAEVDDSPPVGSVGHEPPDQHRLDAVWRELARRWPTGRAAPHIPSWLPWVTTAAVTIALSAGIPWWLLGPDAPEPDLVELRAFPLIEGPEADTEEPEPVEEPPLPTFEFPVPPEEPEEPDLPDDTPDADDADDADDSDAELDGDPTGDGQDPDGEPTDEGSDPGAESSADDDGDAGAADGEPQESA